MRGTRSYKGRRRPDSVWVRIVLRAFKVRKCVCREKVAVPGSLVVAGVVAVGVVVLVGVRAKEECL